MGALSSALYSCAAFCLATSQALAACGFCAEEVTLSAPLAKCYLDRIDDERVAAAKGNSEVHLVDLSFCLLGRSATTLPDLPTDRAQALVLDSAFLIPVAALECLARAVRSAAFEAETVLTFEVQVDCENSK